MALYTVAPATPADYAFPATRDVLRGHTEFARCSFVEVAHRTRRIFGALVDDYALGRRLADFVREKVKGSAPQLLCGVPAILRNVPMDTGAPGR